MKDTSQKKKGRANTDINMFFSSFRIIFYRGSMSEFYYSVSFLVVNYYLELSLNLVTSGSVQENKENSVLLVLQK